MYLIKVFSLLNTRLCIKLAKVQKRKSARGIIGKTSRCNESGEPSHPAVPRDETYLRIVENEHNLVCPIVCVVDHDVGIVSHLLKYCRTSAEKIFSNREE